MNLDSGLESRETRTHKRAYAVSLEQGFTRKNVQSEDFWTQTLTLRGEAAMSPLRKRAAGCMDRYKFDTLVMAVAAEGTYMSTCPMQD